MFRLLQYGVPGLQVTHVVPDTHVTQFPLEQYRPTGHLESLLHPETHLFAAHLLPSGQSSSVIHPTHACPVQYELLVGQPPHALFVLHVKHAD